MPNADLQLAVNELLGFYGGLDVKTAVARLIEQHWPSAEYIAQAVRKALTGDVRRVFQSTDITGAPVYRMREPEEENADPVHVQLTFATEDDWKYTLDMKAKSIRNDLAALDRELDVFEALFGYRYASPFLVSTERIAACDYDDQQPT